MKGEWAGERGLWVETHCKTSWEKFPRAATCWLRPRGPSEEAAPPQLTWVKVPWRGVLVGGGCFEQLNCYHRCAYGCCVWPQCGSRWEFCSGPAH